MFKWNDHLLPVYHCQTLSECFILCYLFIRPVEQQMLIHEPFCY